MDNAFTNILGHVGNAADALFLGGTARRVRGKNAFDDLMGAGDYRGAYDKAAEFGAVNHAGIAGARLQEQSAQEQADLERLRSVAFQFDKMPAEQRIPAIQKLAPTFIQSGILDEEDMPLILQAASVDGGLSALYTSFMSVDEQMETAREDRKLDQADFTNQTGRMNAGTNRMNAETAKYKAENPTAQEAAQGVQSKFTNEAGQVMLVMRDGSIRGTGQSERNPFQIVNVGDTPTAIDRRTGQAIELRGAQGAITPETVGQNKAAVEMTADGIKNRAMLAKQMPEREQRVKLIEDTIDRAIEQSVGANTGPIMGRNPLATNLDATLSTIEANIGFAELQRMRDMSPTGGALGQVTERELALLQAVMGSVRRSQGQRQLDENLGRLRTQVRQSYENIAQAAAQDGVSLEGAATPGINGPSPVDGSVDDLLEKYKVK